MLIHEAMVYDTDERFVDVLAPFVAGGLVAEEKVCVVSRPSNIDLLRDALGADAADIDFLDASDWYRTPARTIAGYHRTVDAARADGATRLRVVGEVEFGSSPAEHAAWTRYESILNSVFAAEPAWIICPYDARRLAKDVVESARRTHLYERTSARCSELCNSFVEPEVFVGPLPLDMGGGLLTDMDLDSDVHRVRVALEHLGSETGLPADRISEVALVISELVTNVLRHGRLPARMRASRDAQCLTVEVTDSGRTRLDPMVGFRRPAGDGIGGAGLWIARQIADRLEIHTGHHGTTVRVRFDLPGPGTT